jgi:hypothetical protein
MKPASESLSLEAARYLKVAEGYCVSARAGGEQSEAKDRPQTEVNPIRPESMTSRRTGGIGAAVKAKAEAWVPGEVRGVSPAVSHDIPRSIWTDGCSGVCGVGMVGRLHGLSQEHRPLRRGEAACQSPHSSDEPSEARQPAEGCPEGVSEAKQPGNDRGAKGDRKVNAK